MPELSPKTIYSYWRNKRNKLMRNVSRQFDGIMPFRIKSKDIKIHEIVNLLEYLNSMKIEYDIIIETKDKDAVKPRTGS